MLYLELICPAVTVGVELFSQTLFSALNALISVGHLNDGGMPKHRKIVSKSPFCHEGQHLHKDGAVFFQNLIRHCELSGIHS